MKGTIACQETSGRADAYGRRAEGTAASVEVVYEKPPHDLFLFKRISPNCQFSIIGNFRSVAFFLFGGFPGRRREAASGCSKMVRTRVDTHGSADFGTLVSRLRW